MNETMNQMEEGISLLELWKIFVKRIGWFIATFIVVISLAIAYLYVAVPEYSSSVTVLVEPIKSSSSLDDVMGIGMTGTSSKISTEVELIKSQKNLNAALSLLDLSSYKTEEGLSYDTFFEIKSNTDKVVVSSVKDTKIVSITVTDQNKQFAADFANALSQSYDNLLTGIAKNSKTVQREFLENQIPLNEKELKVAANALSDYREQSGIMQLTEKSSSLVNQIAYFELKKEPLKLQKVEALSQLETYKEQLSSYNITIPEKDSLTKTEEFIELENKYKTTNSELIMYNLAYSTQGYATTNEISNDVDYRTTELTETSNSLSNRMLDILNNELSSYRTNNPGVNALLQGYAKTILEITKCDMSISLLSARSEQYTEELDSLPLIERKLTELQRDVTVLETIGAQLRTMLEQIKLTEAAVSGNVTVVDRAIVAKRPVSPNVLLILAVAILLGCALGFLVCLFIEMSDKTIQTTQQLKKILGPDIPVLGWVPLIKIPKKTEQKDNLLIYNNPKSIISEKYMGITSNLIYGRNDKKYQIFSLTSCDMSEGKSSAVANISISLARMGVKVIIIENDLRVPSVQYTFGCSLAKKGFVDYIMEDYPLEQCVRQPIADMPNLHILAPGTIPLVPSAVLSNDKFADMLQILRKNYDYIIIDTPPLEYASEVLRIGQLSDLIVLSTRAFVTTSNGLTLLIESLNQIKNKIAGCIYNGSIPSSVESITNYSYSGNYYKKYRSSESHNEVLIKSKRVARKIYKKNLQFREEDRKKMNKFKTYAPLVEGLNLKKTVVSDEMKTAKFDNEKTANPKQDKKVDLSYEDILKNLSNIDGAQGKTDKE